MAHVKNSDCPASLIRFREGKDEVVMVMVVMVHAIHTSCHKRLLKLFATTILLHQPTAERAIVRSSRRITRVVSYIQSRRSIAIAIAIATAIATTRAVRFLLLLVDNRPVECTVVPQKDLLIQLSLQSHVHGSSLFYLDIAPQPLRVKSRSKSTRLNFVLYGTILAPEVPRKAR